MKNKSKSLASVFVKSSIRVFVFTIIVIISTVMYFFYKEVLNNSITYGGLALKNQADVIQEANSKYVYTLQGLEESVSIRISDYIKNQISDDNILNLLTKVQANDSNIYGTYLILDNKYLEANINNKKTKIKNDETSLNFYHTKDNKLFPVDNYKNEGFSSNMINTSELYVGNPEIRTIDKTTSKNVYPIATPIIVDGKNVGIIGFDIDMEYIFKVLENIEIYNGKASIALLDNNGIYLTHSIRKDLIGKSLKEDCPEPELRLKALRDGKYENFYDEGGTVGALTNPLYFSKNQTPWQLQAKVSASVVFASLIKAIGYIIPIIILSFLAYTFTIRKTVKKRLKPLILLSSLSQKISEGDLTQNVDISSNDEIGKLAESFSTMIQKLKDFVLGVQQGSENCKNAALQVGQSSQTLNQLANEQAATSEEISSNAEEMSATVQQNANKSNQIKNSSEQVLSDIKTLANNSEKAANMNEEISQEGEVINNIAFNIKILALNAAVEAARAGENGKGFGVVAREIQKLSEYTTRSAINITEKIHLSTEMTIKINNLIQTTVPKLINMNDDIEEISSASQEQAINIQQVSDSIQNFNNTTQETAGSSEELASTSEELKNQAEKLFDLTKQYNVN